MRGRERLLSEGPQALSELELLSLILGAGVRAPPGAAERLLRGGLPALRRARFASLRGVPGVGEAGACLLLAALELGRRAAIAPAEPGLRLVNAGLVAERLFARLATLGHEEFWALLLTARLEEIRAVRISSGGLSHCSVLPREALSPALLYGAPALAFVHNHPSGDPLPSDDDQRLQSRLDQAAKALGLQLVDHLVLAERGVHSAREGLLPPPAISTARTPDDDEEPCDERHPEQLFDDPDLFPAGFLECVAWDDEPADGASGG